MTYDLLLAGIQITKGTTMATPVEPAETTAQTVGGLVCALFEDLFAVIDRIQTTLTTAFADGPVSAADVHRLVGPDARALLDGGLALGAGYVAAPDALTDHALHLAWWQGEEQKLLGASDSPASGAPFDYTLREWYRTPEQTARRHITGPYVDYVCTDEYVLTCTAPVLLDGRMYGVAGADVLVETLETTLLDAVRAAGVTLVSAHGRAIVSADHRLAPGTLVDLEGAHAVPCGDLPLLLV